MLLLLKNANHHLIMQSCHKPSICIVYFVKRKNSVYVKHNKAKHVEWGMPVVCKAFVAIQNILYLISTLINQ